MRRFSCCAVLVSMIFGGGAAIAQPGGTTTGPDLITGDILSTVSYAGSSGITAYSFGATSCNIGSLPVSWILATNQHPVVTRGLYRLRDGVMEQIGMSWCQHLFFALSQALCSAGACTPTAGTSLGVGCSDPLSASTAGAQQNLGPRSAVNAATGDFAYPFSAPAFTGALDRRLQVAVADLDPTLNPGALYFVSTYYLAADDTVAGNDLNNGSYRQLSVAASPSGQFELQFLAGQTTVRQKSPIEAWQDALPDVSVQFVDVAGDGRIIAACRVIPAAGLYRYEYAFYNQNSDRCVSAISVPLGGATVSAPGFHAVASHSGEPYSNAPWSATISPAEVVWATESFATNPNANALRWDTMYNFRFLSAQAPATGAVTLTLFKPGATTTVVAQLPAPGSAIVEQRFIRGDVNLDGFINIADPVTLLEVLFVPGSGLLDCEKAADANDDGTRDIADVITHLNSLFVPLTPPLAAPYPDCGFDPTPDTLSCEDFAPCP
ncbi:MAG: hypothetical protein ACKVX7_13725 [Planctomycetota bacterium]